MNTTRAIEMLFLLLFLSDPKPILQMEQGLGLKTVLPTAILDEDEVVAQLNSGLTSTFQIQVFSRDKEGKALEGGARIEIRYELWDEVYMIRTSEVDGSQNYFKVGNREGLAAWWRTQPLLILLSDSMNPAEPVRLVLEFIPFSQTEQNNAREWLTESTGGSVSDRRAIPDEPLPQGQGRARIFSVIMATSIKRKVLLRYRWKLPTPAQ